MPTAYNKVERIRQIVQLKQVMRRWKTLSRSRSRLPVFSRSDSDTVSSRPVPPGFLAVYIGTERRRFVIPARLINFPVFASLLKRAEEEFGFRNNCGLVIPCEVEFFRRILEVLETHEGRFKGLGLDGFLELFSDLGTGFDSSCKEGLGSAAHCGFSPLLQKARV